MQHMTVRFRQKKLSKEEIKEIIEQLFPPDLSEHSLQFELFLTLIKMAFNPDCQMISIDDLICIISQLEQETHFILCAKAFSKVLNAQQNNLINEKLIERFINKNENHQFDIFEVQNSLLHVLFHEESRMQSKSLANFFEKYQSLAQKLAKLANRYADRINNELPFKRKLNKKLIALLKVFLSLLSEQTLMTKNKDENLKCSTQLPAFISRNAGNIFRAISSSPKETSIMGSGFFNNKRMKMIEKREETQLAYMNDYLIFYVYLPFFMTFMPRTKLENNEAQRNAYLKLIPIFLIPSMQLLADHPCAQTSAQHPEWVKIAKDYINHTPHLKNNYKNNLRSLALSAPLPLDNSMHLCGSKKILESLEKHEKQVENLLFKDNPLQIKADHSLIAAAIAHQNIDKLKTIITNDHRIDWLEAHENGSLLDLAFKTYVETKENNKDRSWTIVNMILDDIKQHSPELLYKMVLALVIKNYKHSEKNCLGNDEALIQKKLAQIEQLSKLQHFKEEYLEFSFEEEPREEEPRANIESEHYLSLYHLALYHIIQIPCLQFKLLECIDAEQEKHHVVLQKKLLAASSMQQVLSQQQAASQGYKGYHQVLKNRQRYLTDACYNDIDFVVFFIKQSLNTETNNLMPAPNTLIDFLTRRNINLILEESKNPFRNMEKLIPLILDVVNQLMHISTTSEVIPQPAPQIKQKHKAHRLSLPVLSKLGEKQFFPSDLKKSAPLALLPKQTSCCK